MADEFNRVVNGERGWTMPFAESRAIAALSKAVAREASSKEN